MMFFQNCNTIQLEAKPGICIIGEVVGYTENTPKSYDPIEAIFVSKWFSKYDALMLCEHLYERRLWLFAKPKSIHRMAHIIRRNMFSITMMHY